MDVRSVLETKRDGGELSREQIEFFLTGYVKEEVPDYQASALLMAIFVHGMAEQELEDWTRAMLFSGSRLDLSSESRTVVDKHSTGGVGDKVSIPLAPALAACGVAVPMISGRGLGHTGGTLDKLESIPGFRTDLSEVELVSAVAKTGAAFGAQTKHLVPADRKLYALRDVTGLIESIPLIASSILSKKLAEDLGALLLDVKFGTGAFMEDPERGRELATTMQRLAARFDVPTTVFQTSMTRPLGRTAGHALEIAESFDCLTGNGPADLRELVVTFGAGLLCAAGEAANDEAGRERIAAALDSGDAARVMERIIETQGGDPRCLQGRDLLDSAPDVARFEAARAGQLRFEDVKELGRAICALGGGRTRLEDVIDPAVGLVFERPAGSDVGAGDLLVSIHHRAGRGLDEARERLSRAVVVTEHFDPEPLVLARHDP